MSDKLDLIFELVKESRDAIIDIKEEQVKQTINIERNTKDLEHHIVRSDRIEQLVNAHRESELAKFGDVDKRFDTLEAPLIGIKMVVKWITVIGSIAGAVYSVYLALKSFNIV